MAPPTSPPRSAGRWGRMNKPETIADLEQAITEASLVLRKAESEIMAAQEKHRAAQSSHALAINAALKAEVGVCIERGCEADAAPSSLYCAGHR